MTLDDLGRLRARGMRPRGEVWCALGCTPTLSDDIPLTGDETEASLAPLHRLRVVLEHDDWTPREVWALVQRLIAIQVGAVVVTDRTSGRTGLLVHPRLGPTCMTRLLAPEQIFSEAVTWK